MVGSSDAQRRLAAIMQRARLLRVLAKECYETAQIVSYRPDREEALKLAKLYEAEADRLEAAGRD